MITLLDLSTFTGKLICMKYIIPILLLLISCSSKKINSKISHTEVLAADSVKLPIISLTSYGKQISKTQNDTVYCNTNTLLKVSRNIDNLNKTEISEFLSTFHTDCSTNVEFSEWSNELLFQIFNLHTKEVIDLITKKNNFETEVILSALKTPISDEVMPLHLIIKIQKMHDNKQTTKKILQALQVAAGKY